MPSGSAIIPQIRLDENSPADPQFACIGQPHRTIRRYTTFSMVVLTSHIDTPACQLQHTNHNYNLCLLQQRDGIPLEQYPSDVNLLARLGVDFGGIVQSHVHVFVESNNLPLDGHSRVLIEPYLYPLLLLNGLRGREREGARGEDEFGRNIDDALSAKDM